MLSLSDSFSGISAESAPAPVAAAAAGAGAAVASGAGAGVVGAVGASAWPRVTGAPAKRTEHTHGITKDGSSRGSRNMRLASKGVSDVREGTSWQEGLTTGPRRELSPTVMDFLACSLGRSI